MLDTNLPRLDKCRVPLNEPPLAHQVVSHEWVALDEFLCGFTGGEDCHCAFRGISKRPCHEQNTACMELIKPRTMYRIVVHDLGQSTRCHLIEGDDLHCAKLKECPTIHKPRQGVVANILNLQRNGAVGFIGWLGPWVSPIGLSYLPQCERKQRQTKRKYEYSYDRLYALKKSILEQRHKY